MRSRMIEIIPENRDRHKKVWQKLRNDLVLMERRGIPLRERNDYTFEFLKAIEKKSLNEGLIDDMLRGPKKMIADWLATKVGIQEGMLRDILTNFIAGLSISQIQAWITNPGGACESITIDLAGAFQAAIVDQVKKSLGLQPQNVISIAVDEALKSGFVKQGPFVEFMKKQVCSLNASEIFKSAWGSLSGGGDESAATPGTAGAEIPGTKPAT